MKRRILTSSCRRFAYAFVANQRELQLRVTPSRKPIGCVFWPIATFSPSASGWSVLPVSFAPRRGAAGRRSRGRRDGAVRLVADADRQMARPVLDRERATHRARLHALEHRAAVGVRLDDAQVVEVAH